MTRYDPFKHRRRSIRLPEWDYRAPGTYFVTICTYRRETLFAHPAFYDIAVHALQRVPQQPHAQHVQLDAWVVMPNHAHVIFVLVGESWDETPVRPAQWQNASAGSLGVVVGRYKTAVFTPLTNCGGRKKRPFGSAAITSASSAMTGNYTPPVNTLMIIPCAGPKTATIWTNYWQKWPKNRRGGMARIGAG